jgi:hypothetical protein
MEIAAESFRDRKIRSFCIVHDWDAGLHVADISVESNEGVLSRYRISGLSEMSIHDDCGEPYIAFCSVIRSPGRIYISFDPYTEGVESDQDNFCLVGREITALDQK